MFYAIYQIDAFSDGLFTGNPAAVVPLDAFLSDEHLQNIAEENNLSETAYYVEKEQSNFDLRWFTPNGEVQLCGHATLATAYVLFEEMQYTGQLTFHTLSGVLSVGRIASGIYCMDFPADHGTNVHCPSTLRNTISTDIVTCIEGKDDLLLILKTQEDITNLHIEVSIVKALPYRGLIVSAPGEDSDFVSRCFYPKYNIPEDPATGSAHTLLTSYWTMVLRKNAMKAIQLSHRKGYLECIYLGDKVRLIGKATKYLEGKILV
jgi:predicted PhzF superfamily epimerase YddE/YHI9